ncbi:RDD family protein [Dongia rigui]|uniref:RDD family protein n=1 Tax=Dongia rigui TaxID=940149 RepID=A0ABU5E1E3_9PROT|nr:RDD family protein [Dongia rigui]MDY0873049.1 RDD family protein [Dongia rigui]
MTDRKLPSIELARLESARDPHHADADFAPRPAIDLSDSRRFEGILLRRSCAALFDFMIVAVISTVLWLANCVATVGTLGLVSLPAFVLAPVVIHLAMCTYLLAGMQGATFGMRAFGIRVVNVEGRPMDHVQAFLTTAMFFATVPIFLPALAVGFFTQRSRLLHDIVVGTVVLRSNPG